MDFGTPIVEAISSSQDSERRSMHIVRRRARLLDRLVDDLLRALPDLLGVVLDPARLGIDLLVLLLGDRYHLAGVVEDHAPTARGALVDRRCVFRHQLSSLVSSAPR